MASGRPGTRHAAASARAQLVCLPEYVSDLALAADVAYAWAALSRPATTMRTSRPDRAQAPQTRFAVVDRLIAHVRPS